MELSDGQKGVIELIISRFGEYDDFTIEPKPTMEGFKPTVNDEEMSILKKAEELGLLQIFDHRESEPSMEGEAGKPYTPEDSVGIVWEQDLVGPYLEQLRHEAFEGKRR